MAISPNDIRLRGFDSLENADHAAKTISVWACNTLAVVHTPNNPEHLYWVEVSNSADVQEPDVVVSRWSGGELVDP